MTEITREAIEAYLEENAQERNDLFNEMASYDGTGADDQVFEMELFNEFMAGLSPLEVIERVFYGYDADTSAIYTDGRSDRYEEFNPNRSHFYFNGYGNPVSTDYPEDVSADYIEEIINHIERGGCFYELPDEIAEILENDEN